MKFPALLMLFTALVSAPAMAAPTGVWSGTLHWVGNDGTDEMLDCVVAIDYAPGSLTIDDSDGCFYMPQPVTTFEVQGEDLVFDGQQVGKLGDQTVNIAVEADDTRWTLVLNVTAAGSLDALETMMLGDYSDQTDGTLMPEQVRKTKATKSPKARGLVLRR